MKIQDRTAVHARSSAQIFRIKAIALAIASTLACWPGLGRATKHAGAEAAPKAHKSAPEAKQGSQTPAKQGAPLAEWAAPWEKKLDARSYALSEKLDGVRALWDGKKLRFRSGREIAAPAWFLAALPAEALIRPPLRRPC